MNNKKHAKEGGEGADSRPPKQTFFPWCNDFLRKTEDWCAEAIEKQAKALRVKVKPGSFASPRRTSSALPRGRLAELQRLAQKEGHRRAQQTPEQRFAAMATAAGPQGTTDGISEALKGLISKLSWGELRRRAGEAFVIKSNTLSIEGRIINDIVRGFYTAELNFTLNGDKHAVTASVPINSRKGALTLKIREAVIHKLTHILVDEWVTENYAELLEGAGL